MCESNHGIRLDTHIVTVPLNIFVSALGVGEGCGRVFAYS